MIDEDIAKPLDIRLYEGEGIVKPLEYSFNYLRGLINARTNECWNCYHLNKCKSREHILRCKKIKTIVKELKTKGLL
jgi:hypothetical protein